MVYNESMLDWNAIYATGRDFSILPDAIVDFIVAHTVADAPKTFLDVGCGTGWLTRELFQRGYTGIGIDASTEAIAIARSRSQDVEYRVFDIEGDIAELNVQPGLITCKHVYAFIVDKPLFLEKVAKLLAPNGTFALLTPLLESTPEKPSIAVDGAELRRGVARVFDIVVDKSLASGQLLIVRPK